MRAERRTGANLMGPRWYLRGDSTKGGPARLAGRISSSRRGSSWCRASRRGRGL